MSQEQKGKFLKFRKVRLDVTLSRCVSEWADVPEVALVSVAEGDEPRSALGSYVTLEERKSGIMWSTS